MPTAIANNVELHYETHGAGEPVIFIHGGFGGAQSTLVKGPSPIVEAVPLDRYQLITYDRRCAGLSEYCMNWYSLEDIATDARSLLAHLGIEQSVVIGSSMGGMVAQQYALAFPESVTALALLNTGPDLMTHTPWGKSSAETARRAKEIGDDALFGENSARLRNPPTPTMQAANPEARARMEEARERYLKALAETPDEDLKNYFCGSVRNFNAFVGYNFEPRLGEITMPAIIVHGNADAVVPYEYAQTLKAGIPHAEFHEIDGANHGILQYPEARQALHEWLDNL